MKNNDAALRDHLLKALDSDNAHLKFEDAVSDFPAASRGIRPKGAPHSAWELLEHLRITLSDILEFSRDSRHVSPEFPAGYWPASAAPPNDGAWDESAAAYRNDLRAFAELIGDGALDLYTPIAHGDGQTLLREALLAIDHNAYHLGQLVTVKRMLA